MKYHLSLIHIYIPDEVVQLADSNAQLEFFEVVGDFLNQFVIFGEHPFVL